MIRSATIAVLLLLIGATAVISPVEWARQAPKADLGFQFVRVRYQSHPGFRESAWATDYPTAEYNLHEAIERTTGLYLEGPPIVLSLTDDRIFEHPVLYLTEPGYWRTHEEEVANLRKYLDRGGFLIIDDFHDYGRGRVGPQWNNMYDNMKRVFPDREPVELTATHPIWSIYYDIDPDAAISTKNGGRRRFGIEAASSSSTTSTTMAVDASGRSGIICTTT